MAWLIQAVPDQTSAWPEEADVITVSVRPASVSLPELDEVDGADATHALPFHVTTSPVVADELLSCESG